MPPNTVYVGRPGKWGNPFKEINGHVFVWDPSKFHYVEFCPVNKYPYGTAVKMFESLLTSNFYEMDVEPEIRSHFKKMRSHIHELKGKNLACWCKPGEPCHADVLLEMANEDKVEHSTATP